MDKIEFKEQMEKDGFKVSEKSMAAGTVTKTIHIPLMRGCLSSMAILQLGRAVKRKSLDQEMFVASMQVWSIQKGSVR